MSVKNWDPKKHQVIVAGSPATGFANGTFIVVARNNDSFTLGTGADGEGARAQSNDRSGTIVITLLHTSLTNDVLAAALAADELTGNGVFPVLVKDLNGTMLAQAETMWVRKPADSSRGREVEETEWTLETNDMVNRTVQRVGARRYKTYRIYEKSLDG